MTDAGISALAHGCAALNVLWLVDCAGVTDAAVAALADHAICLRYLHVFGTGITAAGETTAAQLIAKAKAWKERFKRRRLAILCREAHWLAQSA